MLQRVAVLVAVLVERAAHDGGRSVDKTASAASGEHVAQALEVVDVAGAGHMVAGDKNDVFNTAVIDFVQRHG